MKWVDKSQVYSQHAISYYSSAFLVDPLTTKLLFDRGITNEDAFSKYAYPSISDLYDPFLLSDMKKAIVRTIRAIRNKEKIVIYGDYDVDGITSASLLYKGLRFFNADVLAILPTRKDGYGLTVNSIEKMVPIDPILIITVDNGSNAHDALRFAVSKGIDVIVTDHHEINGPSPLCYAFVNPKRHDNEYPNPYLAGAGVSFKMVQALFEASNRYEWRKNAWDYIELAALGTIADLMPLTGENRVIGKLGLSKMNANPSAHFRHLFSLLRLSFVDSSTISYLIAPILNSSGRIGDPNDALRTLINDEPSIHELSGFIEQNNERKRLTIECFRVLNQSILNQKLHSQNVIVVCGDYPEGLIGILAAKITEKYHKPAIVITTEGKGSCRSVQNTDFSIVNVLDRCAHSLKAYGGHKAAAGLTMDIALFKPFVNDIQNAAAGYPPIRPMKQYDCQFGLGDFSDTLFENFMLMEPFGLGNQKPVFFCKDSADSFVRFGNQLQHAKIRVGKRTALMFGKADFVKSNDFYGYQFLYTPNSYKKRDFIINDIKINTKK